MRTFQFDWPDLKLPLAQASLHYIGGVDPALRWEKRGLKSHQKDEEASRRLQEAINEANRQLRTPAGQEKLQKFMGESLEIFNDLLRTPNWLDKHFPDHRFYFIIGPMRTGGTYIFTELCNMFGIDWKDLNFRMVHDSIPTPEFLAFLENPISWLPFAFELAQYLNWVKREYPSPRVIKKRITFGHCLGVMDRLFGDRAEYLLLTRHPAGIAQSGSELLESFHQDAPNPEEQGWNVLVQDRTKISEEKWEALAYEERILKYWEVYFRDAGESLPLNGTLRTVVFGENSEQVISRIAADNSRDYEPGKFSPKDREFDEFWSSEKVEECFDEVRSTWRLHGVDFPAIPLR